MSDQAPGTNNEQPQDIAQQTSPASTQQAAPSPDPSPGTATDPASGNGQSPVPPQGESLPALPSGPQPPDPSLNDNSLLADPIFAAIHNAFLVGWNLLELKSRLLIAAIKADTAEEQVSAFDLVDTLLKDVRASKDDNDQKLPIEPSDAAWNASVWRAMFNRIVALQSKRFPYSNSARTIYDVPATAYEYLYQGNAENFTAFGVSSTDIANFGAQQGFKLYDATRRLINCLSLLYIQPNDTLDVTAVTDFQGEIRTLILAQQPPPPSTDPVTAIKRFTGVTVRFLEVWDSFLREKFYIGRDFENFEIEMIAYEAGRSMTSLSWGIALKTIPLEDDLQQKPDDIALMQQLYFAWKNVFNERDVIHIQHKIYTLTTDIDAAYNRVKQKNQQSSATPDGGNPPSNNEDPCLPSVALHAIKNSLDYWQSAIEWLGSPVAQASICQAHGITPVPAKPILPAKLARQLRTALIQQADIWQSLITGQQNLSVIMTETVTQKILSNFMAECEKAVSADIGDEIKATARKFAVPLSIVGAIALILLVLFFVFVVFPVATTLTNIIISLFSFLGIGFVAQRLYGAGSQSREPASLLGSSRPNTLGSRSSGPSVFARVGGFFGENETSIFDVFQKCNQVVRNEFATLDRNVSVANPLVEFFVVNSGPNSASSPNTTGNAQGQQSASVSSASSPNNAGSPDKKPGYDFAIKDSYSFLQSIVWTNQERDQEIKSIVRTAFGPIGALVGARLHKTNTSGSPQS